MLMRNAAFSASNSAMRADSIKSCSFFRRRYACAASRLRSSRCLALPLPACSPPPIAAETSEADAKKPSQPAAAAPAAVFLLFFFTDSAELPLSRMPAAAPPAPPDESSVPLRERCRAPPPPLSKDADRARRGLA